MFHKTPFISFGKEAIEKIVKKYYLGETLEDPFTLKIKQLKFI